MSRRFNITLKFFKKNVIQLLCVALVFFNTAVLTSCEQLFGGIDNAEPPRKLTKIKPTKKLDLLWAAKVGGGDYTQYLKIKPLVLTKQVITVDGNGRMQARDSKTGKLTWAKKLGQKVTAGVSGNEKQLFISLANGDLLSLSSKTGHPLWQAHLGKNMLNTATVDNQGSHVYVQASDGTINALSAANGKILWEYKVLVPDLTIYTNSSPIIWQDKVIAGFANGKIFAFNRKDGSPVWDYTVAVPQGRSSIHRMVDISARPQVVGDVLYAASYQGNVVAVDLNNGSEKWKFDLSVIDDFSTHGKYLYVSDTEGTVWALNRHSGRVLWRQPDLHMRHLSGTVFTNNTVLVGDYAGYLHAISEEHGGLVGRARLGRSGIRVAPQVKHGIIYALDNSGRLAAYKIS